MIGALLLEHQQRALDRPDRGLGDIPVFRGELTGAISQVLQQRLQVLEIEQRQLFVVGDFEGDIEHAFFASLRSIRRDRRSGPNSETVARIGWPFSPNRSQKMTG